MIGHVPISALAMYRGRRPISNIAIIGTNTSNCVTWVAAVMYGPSTGTFSRPHARSRQLARSTLAQPSIRRPVSVGFCSLISCSFGSMRPVGYGRVGSTRSYCAASLATCA